ncbi:hypothetical protein BDW69DRAFT_181064 [Aspergillus filifer]
MPKLAGLLWLSSLSLAGLAYATVTGHNEVDNAFVKSSFETGDLTNWELYRVNVSPYFPAGSVVSGDADDGNSYYSIPGAPAWSYLSQTLINLDTAKTYTLSVDARLTNLRDTPLPAANWCYLGWSED